MKDKILKFTLSCFLIFFLVLLFAEKFGYYETKEERIKVLTDEQIKVFEEDIKNGVAIDVSDYVIESEKDYTNNLSKNIYKISLKLEKGADKLIRMIFNKASKVVSD